MPDRSTLLARAIAAIEPQLDSEARMLGGWIDPPVVPLLPDGARAARLIYAFPSLRLASLRHWRQTAECWSDGERTLHVVAHEVSIWARFILKSHGGAIAIATSEPIAVDEDPGATRLLRMLGEIAGASVDDTALSWAARAGVVLPAPAEPIPPGKPRFEVVNGWVESARRWRGNDAAEDATN